MYEGQFYVRSEISENAPDVVQAFSDAFAEATLGSGSTRRRQPTSWPRIQSEELLEGDPAASRSARTTISTRPTHIYPHAQFWGAVNETSSSGCTAEPDHAPRSWPG